MTPDSEAKFTKETGFHQKTSLLTRDFTEYRGYWLPTSYRNNGAIEEYFACREKAIITDLSPLRKFEILGPDSEALMQWVLTRNVRKLAIGQHERTSTWLGATCKRCMGQKTGPRSRASRRWSSTAGIRGTSEARGRSSSRCRPHGGVYGFIAKSAWLGCQVSLRESCYAYWDQRTSVQIADEP